MLVNSKPKFFGNVFIACNEIETIASGFKPEVKIDFVYTVYPLTVAVVMFILMSQWRGQNKFVLTKVRYYDELGDKMFFNLCFSQKYEG